MNCDQPFEAMLTGGHPNSLGQTEDVVACILADEARLGELYDCYSSADEVVRLRVSGAFKRLWRAQPEWLVPYIERFLTEVPAIQQASTQWTLALFFLEMRPYFSDEQHARALAILKHNIEHWDDWIVLNNTMETLGTWAKDDPELAAWLKPHLDRLSQEKRKSVAGRARKWLAALS